MASDHRRSLTPVQTSPWRRDRFVARAKALVWLGASAAACPSRPAPTTASPAGASFAPAESVYADLRWIRDRIDITTATQRATSPDGATLTELSRRHNEIRRGLLVRLATIDPHTLTGDDARALDVVRGALAGELGALADSTSAASPVRQSRPDCEYGVAAIAPTLNAVDSLKRRLYACYGWSQQHVSVDEAELDRRTILDSVTRTEDAERRRRLFLALGPVWRSVNGDGGPASPYRRLVALEAARRGGGESPAALRARALGVHPDTLERWLVALLETWRASTPDSVVEPWDWFYVAGRASRALSPRISAERMGALNAEVFRALGADVSQLGVRYDLAPREGKTPVAYTTFGARARLRHGAWTPAEPWVFATYRSGGLDNLTELLHETGHAVHIAAIRTRPAFADWPDSDPFTEALGDFVALDIYEPAWQARWLGDSVPLADGLRARYAGIVLDVAWALFEIRLERDPGADPNEVWTAITRDYLRIRPHPALSWWAMRGQLVDEPGYMLNYAAGAILIAAIRARTRELHGPFVTGDSTWYAWVAPRLYRFGLERPSREVIETFLGGPVSPAAILADMRRMRQAPAAPR